MVISSLDAERQKDEEDCGKKNLCHQKSFIVERTINEFASSRSVFFGNEAHETKSSVLHSRRTRYGLKQMSLRALYF